LLSDNVVVTFPDGIISGGLRTIALKFISATEIQEIATFLPNPGDQDAEYRFMSTGSIGNDRFFIAYIDIITNTPLTVLVGALSPNSILQRISPVFDLGTTVPQDATDVIWISGVGISDTRFAVAFSFSGDYPNEPAGGQVIIGDLSNSALGYITSATNTVVTLATSGVITTTSILNPGNIYYTNLWGDLIEGPPFDYTHSLPTIKQNLYYVTAAGQIVTEVIGVAISSNQLLLLNN